MEDCFFDYGSSARCLKCNNPCNYTAPRDPAYARIAVCCSSLNLLATAILRAWTATVESGRSSPQMTRWLVEIARVFKPVSIRIEHLLTCAFDNLNQLALLELQHETGLMRHGNQNAIAATVLRALHLGLHRGACIEKAKTVLRLFLKIMAPPERVMHGLVWTVIAFSCCIPNPDQHRALLEVVLGPSRSAWWMSLRGGIACALRWGDSPSQLMNAFQSRGIDSLALPSWEFDALSEGSAVCHNRLQTAYPFFPNMCNTTTGLSVPLAPAPYHVYGILYSRVSSMRHSEFKLCAGTLHACTVSASLADHEMQRATMELLSTLFRSVSTLKCAETVISCLGEVFPPALRAHLPPADSLGINQPVLIQLALVKQGVSAAKVCLGISLSGTAFLEIRLKLALVLAQAGAAIQPHEACWNRWAVETAAQEAPDSIQRFLALCDYGEDGSPFPKCPDFASLAVRCLLLYNMGSPNTKLPRLMRGLGFGDAAELAGLWTDRFSILSYCRYPVSCCEAVLTFIMAVRRVGVSLPHLPAELVLAILEAGAGPLHFGRCKGPWESGESFPVSSVELGVLDASDVLVGQRIGAV
jgi:hypothetical protein